MTKGSIFCRILAHLSTTYTCTVHHPIIHWRTSNFTKVTFSYSSILILHKIPPQANTKPGVKSTLYVPLCTAHLCYTMGLTTDVREARLLSNMHKDEGAGGNKEMMPRDFSGISWYSQCLGNKTLQFKSLLLKFFLAAFNDSLIKSVTAIFPGLKTHVVFLRMAAKVFFHLWMEQKDQIWHVSSHLTIPYNKIPCVYKKRTI